MNIAIHYEEFGYGNHLLIVTLKSALDLSALFPHPWNKIGSDRGIASYVTVFTVYGPVWLLLSASLYETGHWHTDICMVDFRILI